MAVSFFFSSFEYYSIYCMQGQQNKKATFLRYGMMVFIYYNIFKASGALL
jgi:hypothetical protein